MKILISITYYSPNISGLTIYAQILAEELVKRGHQVTVLTSKYQRNLKREEVINGVRVIRVPVAVTLGKGVIMPKLPLVAFDLIKDSDLVNCHLPEFESSQIAILTKALGKKLILTHHTDLSSWSGIANQLAEKSVFISQMLAGILADKIVVYTKDYANHSSFLKHFKVKITEIYPPIRIWPINKKKQEEFRRKIGSTKYLIGFSGRIAKQKGIPHLLAAIPTLQKSLEDFKIVLAGPYKEVIGEKYFDEISNLVKTYRDNLVFLGPIPHSEMASFYSLLDVLVLPSDDRLESFGLVQVEAMLNGCPVVATNLPGVRVPIQRTGMGKLVRPGDSKQLADAIAEVVLNKEAFLKKKSIVEPEFAFNKTISFYERLLPLGDHKQ